MVSVIGCGIIGRDHPDRTALLNLFKGGFESDPHLTEQQVYADSCRKDQYEDDLIQLVFVIKNNRLLLILHLDLYAFGITHDGFGFGVNLWGASPRYVNLVVHTALIEVLAENKAGNFKEILRPHLIPAILLGKIQGLVCF